MSRRKSVYVNPESKDEIERLLLEKRKIDDKIRLLKEGCVQFLDLESLRYVHKTEVEDDRVFQISSRMTQVHREYETHDEAIANEHTHRELTVEYETQRLQVFIREKTKEETMKKIRQIIGDLSQLIDYLTEEEV